MREARANLSAESRERTSRPDVQNDMVGISCPIPGPTNNESIRMILEEVEVVCCPNLRSGFSFAVADAYEKWSDLDEEEVIKILEEFKNAAISKKG